MLGTRLTPIVLRENGFFVKSDESPRISLLADFTPLISTRACANDDQHPLAQRVGIGGALFVEANVDMPRGSVKFMRVEWRALFKHVVAETERLGAELKSYAHDEPGRIRLCSASK